VKDLLQVQDYLFSHFDVGDWEGDEEQVAETLNELIHFAWDMLPDDLSCEVIDEIINGIWEHLRGDTALQDAEFEELTDWVTQYVHSSLDELMQ
jgi:predicted Zn-dependent protease with MMP-like domain